MHGNSCWHSPHGRFEQKNKIVKELSYSAPLAFRGKPSVDADRLFLKEFQNLAILDLHFACNPQPQVASST